MLNHQELVNAQVEINRANFIVNARLNESIASRLDDVSDEKVITHIKIAIRHLQQSIGVES